MERIGFFLILFFLVLSLLTNFAVIPPETPQVRFNRGIKVKENNNTKSTFQYIEKAAYQKRKLEFTSVRRQ